MRDRQREQFTVGALEHAVGRLGADVGQRRAVHHRPEHHRHPRHQTIGHRDVDVLSLAVAFAFQQRRQRPHRREHAGRQIADRDAARLLDRPNFGMTEQKARERLIRDVMRGPIAIRAILPESRDRHINQPRIELRHRLVTEAEARHSAGTISLHQHVGGRDQAAQMLLALIALEIQCHRLLAAIERGMERRELPCRITDTGTFDQNHLSTEIAQQ
ncbi:MAG: hypothetical protein J0H51_16040 [Rhizobiales bacterium]|nr:hypothetical protein [Hyphomicrobiales bacterium]